MFLNSINKKVFLISFMLIYAVVLFLYIYVYIALPENYKDYKKIQTAEISNQVEEDLTKKLEDDHNSGASKKTIINDIINYLNNVSKNNNVSLYLLNDFGYILWSSDSIENGDDELHQQGNINEYDANRSYYKKININYEDNPYSVIVQTKLQQVEEVRDSLRLLIPNLIIFDFIVSFLIALFFVYFIARPIKKLRKKSIELEKFNFDNTIKINRNDEIGDLSKSLDKTSMKLSNALLELKNDVAIAKRREQERRQYMAIMSHELKTPLTILRGQSECMIEGIGDYKNHNKYLGENVKIIDKMEDLVQSILLSTKLDSLKDDIKKEKINIKEVINKIIEQFQLLLNEKKLEIKTNFKKEEILADKYTIEQGFKNIIENAIKYSDENSVINIDVLENKILIINKNKEINKKDFKNIFEPFVRIESSRNSNTGGTGIGLYIVKRALEINNFKYSLYKNKDNVIFEIKTN